ncbi:MAG TPA: TIR domain-containing protein [Pyrinomonadaceae bacterium]|nr:TIR domain-containing protein [Pyrinomonadaceae bacterium]
MQHEVFISHATEDLRKTEAVARALEDAGIRCWYAPRDIAAGSRYEEAIVDAIAASRVVVLIVSGESNESLHVGREINIACADEPGVPVIPVRVEDVRLNKVLRFYLGSPHWFDATAPPFESHLPRLVEQLRARLGKPAPDAAATKPDAGATKPDAVATPPEAPKPEPGAGHAREAEKVERQPPQANAAPVAPPPVSDHWAVATGHPGYNDPPVYYSNYVPPPPEDQGSGVFLGPPLTAILSVLFVVSLLGIRVSTLRNPMSWGTVALLVLSTLVLLVVQAALYPLHIKLLGRPHRGVLALALVLALAGFIYGWSAQLKNADERASAATAATAAGVSVSGRVFAGESAAAGLRVELAGTKDDNGPAVVTTDDRGRFVFKNVPRDAYFINVTPPPGYHRSTPLIDAHEGKDVDVGDIRLEAVNVK